jgi:hypothetical protein
MNEFAPLQDTTHKTDQNKKSMGQKAHYFSEMILPAPKQRPSIVMSSRRRRDLSRVDKLRQRSETATCGTAALAAKLTPPAQDFSPG